MRAAPEISFRKKGAAEWVTKFADIFYPLTDLILSCPGKMTTVFKFADKAATFKAKLGSQQGNTGIFVVSNISRDFGKD